MSGRLDRARSALMAADVLLQEGLFGDAVSRAYYAAFYAARAAVRLRGEDPHTHKGVHVAFDRLVVHAGAMETATASTLRRLFGRRLDADYDDGATITEAQAREALDLARQFVQAVAALLSREPT